MKILTFSNLYPNAAQPNHGVFVENRLRHLIADGRVTAQVMAPVPWFPWRNPGFGRYATFAAVPRHEVRHGIKILHPRHPVIPKFGMSLAPHLMYTWLKPAVAKVLDSGYGFDLIDAHFFYPDGVAAVMLGRHFSKPVTITARGSDLNLHTRHARPRRMMRSAAGQADGVITVSAGLSNRFRELGFKCRRLRTLRNGIDLKNFRPVERAPLMEKLGIESPVLLSVGNLLPAKGHGLVIRALPHIPQAVLLIAGQGPDEDRLRQLAQDLGLSSRVRFLGTLPHAELYQVYNAADVLVLASAHEGWPNVLLEAMACGTPAAASNIPGIPEILAEPAAGALIPSRDPESIAETVNSLLANPPGRAKTRTYAEGFSWDETTEGQIELFTEILAERAVG